MPQTQSGAASQKRRTFAIALATLCALFMAGCSFSCSVGTDSDSSSDEVSGSRYAESAKQLLEEKVGGEIESFECPDKVKVETGGEFRCTLTTPDGTQLGATVTMTDEDGGFDVKVDSEPMNEGSAS